MNESFEAVVKQAFHDANVNHDCKFRFELTHKTVAALTIAQCIVQYDSGNEYIRLDRLFEKLKAAGKIDLIEFRGRGAQDATQIVVDMTFDGQRHQVIYLLP